ncbi:putative methyltransferase chloroplastic isoform X2 [Gossypium australe]|uniref:Putative methyltransferase chloroplastic isoform X2 n=1 Tax=Gossypium australe TaxID=47621 RepID=A0A5B6VBK4_9ROSI|nr:putative methyltransferase chloroplastic isoform X2 [Gossypium australe]
MPTVFTSNIRLSFFPSQLNRNLTLLFLRPFTIPVFTTSLAAIVRVSSTAFVEIHPTEPVVVEKEDSGSDNVLACPICYDPLTWTVGSPSYVGSKSRSNLQGKTCKKSYFGNQTHLDLVASTGSKQYDNSMPLATELFRTPVVSFLYERGPGKEFEMAKKYLKPVLGGNIVDASCGSGLFSRLFAKSGLFSQVVVALDYSENMLRQSYEFIVKEENFPKEYKSSALDLVLKNIYNFKFEMEVTLVRADISRLPFKSSSVDALHAGAALHCWPSPSTAVAEISRVLRPGGVFVATTYILDGPFIPFLRTFRQNVMRIVGSHIFLSERELEDLCRTCGLVGFTCIRNSRFVMISARKRS